MITEIDKAVDYLRMRQLPLSISEAIGVLREVAEVDRFLALYHQCFPKEFATSKAPLLRRPGQAYSQREAEFFELVNRQLFPIPYLTDYVLEDWEAEERSPYIPMVPWGRDWWDEYDLEPGWQVLLLLAEEFQLNQVTHYSFTLHRRPDWPELEPLLQEALPLTIPPGHLEQTAAQAEKPLCFLPLALKLVQHDTGNLWIDTTPDSPVEDVFWCSENIELLTKECQQAEAIMDQVTRLVSWLEQDLVSHCRKVVELWQHSAVPA